MLVEEQERLRRVASQWGVSLSADAAGSLLGYGQLLLDWNARINLTGAKSLAELIDEHFPDAFAVASRVRDAVNVVDVGSGGGLPAVPVAILVPQITLLMIEPIHKKVAFLRTAVRTFGLSGRASVLAQRFEGGKALERTDGFDLVMSRATFHPGEWLQRAKPLVGPGGRVLALSAEESVPAPEGLQLEDALTYSHGRRWLLSYVRST